MMSSTFLSLRKRLLVVQDQEQSKVRGKYVSWRGSKKQPLETSMALDEDGLSTWLRH